ncbi:MAG: hypothetical protein AABX29_05260 [Nanoarchaeota archaeon]
MNKKGQGGLSMDTIIIAVIAIIVLLLIVTFFTGGMATVFGKIRNVFSGGTAGYDIDLAKNNCQDYCTRAQGLATDVDKEKSTYCTYTFNMDTNDDKKVDDKDTPQHCYASKINVGCVDVKDKCIIST